MTQAKLAEEINCSVDAQVSTTSDIYAHVIAEADKKNADILSEIFLKKA